MISLLLAFIVILVAALVVSLVFLARFIRYILDIEDTLAEAIEVHERTIQTFERSIRIPVIFDSPHVQQAMKDVMDDVKMCKLATQQVAQDFVRLSKHKYIEKEVVEKE